MTLMEAWIVAVWGLRWREELHSNHAQEEVAKVSKYRAYMRDVTDRVNDRGLNCVQANQSTSNFVTGRIADDSVTD